MSDRRLSTRDTAMRDTLRAFEQRIGRLETLLRSQGQGLASVGKIQVMGDVQITVTPSGVGDGRVVTFVNSLTGSSETIDLP